MSAPMPDFEPADARARRWGPRRRVWIAAVAGAALVAGALAIGIPASQRDRSAQLDRLVTEYVAAVEAGDAEAAAALHTPDGDDVGLALLALAQPSIPAEVECAAPEVSGDDAVVRCVVAVGDLADPYAQQGAMTIDLARDGDWAIVAGLDRRASTFLAAGEVAAIGGAALPAGAGVTRGPLLLPGVYDVDLATSPLVVVVGDAGMVVGPSGASVLVGRLPAPEVLDDASTTALAHVEACIAADEAAGDCAEIALAPDATLEATRVEAGPDVGWQGTAFVQPVLVGPAGGESQVEATVLVRFDASQASYELEVEGVSTVQP